MSPIKSASRRPAANFFGSALALPDNPIPPGAVFDTARTRDGRRLRVATWDRTDGPDRGTFIILQGRAEFIEKYFETVTELRARGFAVLAFDWRGQGGSDRLVRDRRRGHVGCFDEFRLDYEAVRKRAGDGPVHALAHSMGGCVALSGAREGWLAVDRLVVSSPMVGLSLIRRPRLARGLARLLTSAGFGRSLVPGGRVRSISTLPFKGNRLSTDPARYRRNAAVAAALGCGAIGSPTIGWVRAAYDAMERLADPAVAAGIDMPVLVVAGAEDPICSTPATRLFAKALGRGTLLVVPGARHEVLMETDAMRAAFWDALDAFLSDAPIVAPQPAALA